FSAMIYDPVQQIRFNENAGGIVGIAQEQKIGILCQERKYIFSQPQLLHVAGDNLAACRLQRLPVFGKGRSRYDSPGRTQRQYQGKDQFRGSVSADEKMIPAAVHTLPEPASVPYMRYPGNWQSFLNFPPPHQSPIPAYPGD